MSTYFCLFTTTNGAYFLHILYRFGHMTDSSISSLKLEVKWSIESNIMKDSIDTSSPNTRRSTMGCWPSRHSKSKLNSLDFLSQTSLKLMIFGWATSHRQRVARLISHGKRKSKAFRMCLKMRSTRYLIQAMSLIYFLIVGMVNIPLCFAVYLARKCRLNPSL